MQCIQIRGMEKIDLDKMDAEKKHMEERNREEVNREVVNREETELEEVRVEEADEAENAEESEELEMDPFKYKGELLRDAYSETDKLNMRILMESFMRIYEQTYGPLIQAFPAEDGRELFLRFLAPIVEGRGSITIDEQTKNENCTDVIIEYCGQQYLIGLRIWRRERHAAKGKQQVLEYLDRYGLKNGYMLSFVFDDCKVTGVQWVNVGEKVICEGTI